MHPTNSSTLFFFYLITIIMFLIDTVYSVIFKAVRFEMDVLLESGFWKRFKEHATKASISLEKNPVVI